MGDSYASGIGAGSWISVLDSLCYRYDQSYPVDLNNQLQVASDKFNFVACSGESFPDILRNQFLDSARYVPSYRPPWGQNPEFVTLSMGGNDIGIRDLVSVCIYNITLFTSKDCETIIQDSQASLQNPVFQQGAQAVIRTALQKGTERVGKSFKVFVAGYAQFFNETTTQCNDVVFQIGSGTNKQYLTQDRRQKFNQLARGLSDGLNTAVQTVSPAFPGQVFYVDIDAAYQTHRFCDREEPNPADPDTWFFNYGSPDEDEEGLENFLASLASVQAELRQADNSTVYDIVGEVAGNDTVKKVEGAFLFRVFHPKPAGHVVIKDAVQNTRIAAVGGSVAISK